MVQGCGNNVRNIVANRHSVAAGRDINLIIYHDLAERLEHRAHHPCAVSCQWCGLRGQPPLTDACLYCGARIGRTRKRPYLLALLCAWAGRKLCGVVCWAGGEGDRH